MTIIKRNQNINKTTDQKNQNKWQYSKQSKPKLYFFNEYGSHGGRTPDQTKQQTNKQTNKQTSQLFFQCCNVLNVDFSAIEKINILLHCQLPIQTMGQKVEICSKTINHLTEKGGEIIQYKNYNL